MRIVCLPALLAASLAIAGCGSDTPTRPSPSDLTGRWSGTSTYPNSPFELQLAQTGGSLRGSYQDAHDRSLSVGGTFADAAMGVVIDFGDAKLNLEGNVVDAHTVQGPMYTSALGNRRYPFTMTR